MNWRKYILFPFGLIYGTIAWMRRKLFDAGIFKRNKMSVPTLVVGNLQVGGAGKTPMTIWLAGMLNSEFRPAVLSRGYGRKTKTFREVFESDSADLCGDEPLEIRGALPFSIRNFVDANRPDGIENIKKEIPGCDLVLLDDAFQHLPLLADFYLLLTPYQLLFTKDFPMPAGNLREFAATATKAHAIVVTKCPANLELTEALEIFQSLSRYGAPVYFAAYENAIPEEANGKKAEKGSHLVLVSALADNTDFATWASDHYHISQKFSYPDHHAFTEKEIQSWKNALAESGAIGILTTRKDLMRIPESARSSLPLFVSYTQPVFLFSGDEALLTLIHNRIK